MARRVPEDRREDQGPVTAVPITAPPCQISGGVPLAVSPAVGALVLRAGQPVWAFTALTMPAKWPIRGPWPFEAQALGVCDGVLAAASAAVLVASRVAVPSAATVRAARRPRRLRVLAIRVLRSAPGTRAVGGSPEQGARLDIRFRARHVVSRCVHSRGYVSCFLRLRGLAVARKHFDRGPVVRSSGSVNQDPPGSTSADPTIMSANWSQAGARPGHLKTAYVDR